MKQWFYSVLFGGALLIIGPLFIWEGVPHTYSVTCERTTEEQIDCKKQERLLWWILIKTTSLKQLQSVRRGKGENAYDSAVYFIYLNGENNNLMFGNTLDLEEIQADLLKAQQFLENSKTQSLLLERYKVNWTFAIVGFLVGALGFWTLIYRYEQPNN